MNMNKTFFSRAKQPIYTVAVMLAAALVGSYAPVQATSVKLAVDTTNAQVQTLKNQMNQELDRRISNVEQGGKAISDSTAFSADTKSKLQKSNTDTLSTMKSLKQSVNSASTLPQAQQLASSVDSQYNQYQISNGQGAIAGDVSNQKQTQQQLSSLLSQAQSQLNSYCGQSQSTDGTSTSGDTSSTGSSSSANSAQLSTTVQVGGSNVSVCGGSGSSNSSSGSSSSSSSSSGGGGSGLQQIISQLVQLAAFVASIIASVIALVTAIQSGNTAGALTAAMALMTTILGQLGLTDSTLTQAITTATSVITAMASIK